MVEFVVVGQSETRGPNRGDVIFTKSVLAGGFSSREEAEAASQRENFASLSDRGGANVITRAEFNAQLAAKPIEKEIQARDVPRPDVEDAIHITSTGKIGFPAFGFKKGIMECTSFVGDKNFSKKLVSGSVKIINVEDGLIPIKYKKQTVLEHNIGPQTKMTPCFHDWNCELDIRYDKNNISAQDIITLINYAGFYNGIGAWRPKGGGGGSGEYGTFEVVANGNKL